MLSLPSRPLLTLAMLAVLLLTLLMTAGCNATSPTVGTTYTMHHETRSAADVERDRAAILGMAGEFADKGVAVNALWPRTTIATAAVKYALGGDAMMNASRTPEIMADAAHWVLTQPASTTGNFFIDDEVLERAGVTDLSGYAVVPGNTEFFPDLFL